MRACVLPLVLILATGLWAQDGGQVVQGDASISKPDGSTTIIDQVTDRAVIEWDGFGVEAGHLVRFNQPGVDSALLNRIVGPDASLILGRLEANGNILILNPNGILFGQGSQVHVPGD